MTYRIDIATRDYTSWTLYDPDTNALLLQPTLSIQPAIDRLFSKDVFTLDQDGKIVIQKSSVRMAKSLAGVLQLAGNRTYGRTPNKKRLFYKCIPDDKHLPDFLVPYDVKLGFSKNLLNKYVVFRFDEWTGTHPTGILVETLGDVDQLDAFYEYQLYCKSLHISLTNFTKQTQDALRDAQSKTIESQIISTYSIADRTHDRIFTIDPTNSLDFDDGFGIRKDADGTFRVSIYIANVWVWIEALSLWKSFSKRVATIYLPDHRRPMLPTILADSLCSLQEKQTRFAFVMDLTLNDQGELLQPPIFSNASIQVTKNYRYEEPNLQKDPDYVTLMQLSSKMDKSVKNSHDLVAHWMLRMNTECAKWLVSQKRGIFRSVKYNSKMTVSKEAVLKDESRRVIEQWNNLCGQYQLYGETGDFTHEVLEIQHYTHVTSPIRRLVDLLNQMIMVRALHPLSEAAEGFIVEWQDSLDYINASMRSIRKIQTDCETLCRCMTDPDIMARTHRGIVFDKVQKTEVVFTYMVYLEEIRLLTRMTAMVDLENYQYADFRLYLFENADHTKKKIRIQPVK